MPSTTYKKETSTEAAQLAAIVAHPARVRAWLILMERVASPKQIADELGMDVRDLTYHINVLRKFDLIELVGEEPVRGAVRHLYRSRQRVLLDTEGTAALTEEEANANGRHVLQLLFADATVALEAGTLVRRRDHALARIPMVVDEEGWRELAELNIEHVNRLMDVQARSAARLSESGEPEIPVTTASITFEGADAKLHRTGT